MNKIRGWTFIILSFFVLTLSSQDKEPKKKEEGNKEKISIEEFSRTTDSLTMVNERNIARLDSLRMGDK